MGTQMFKIGSFEAELADSMEKTLVTAQLENKYSFDKVSKAADYINAAAELLDDTGFSTEAKVLTTVIQRLADDKGGDLTDEEISDLLLGKRKHHHIEPGDSEIIIEPIDQEIVERDDSSYSGVDMFKGKHPLKVNPGTEDIIDDLNHNHYTVKVKPGQIPLSGNYHSGSIFEDFNAPKVKESVSYESLASVAEKLTAKYAKKKA